MRFADELRGSVGEECIVVDVLSERVYLHGMILRWDDRTGKADVKLDDGRIVQKDFSLVRLIGDEKP